MLALAVGAVQLCDGDCVMVVEDLHHGRDAHQEEMHQQHRSVAPSVRPETSSSHYHRLHRGGTIFVVNWDRQGSREISLTPLEAINRTIELDASPARVWVALADPDGLGSWFPDRVEGLAPEEGSQGWLVWDNHGRYAIASRGGWRPGKRTRVALGPETGDPA